LVKHFKTPCKIIRVILFNDYGNTTKKEEKKKNFRVYNQGIRSTDGIKSLCPHKNTYCYSIGQVVNTLNIAPPPVDLLRNLSSEFPFKINNL